MSTEIESVCPKCLGPRVVKANMFFWRGQMFSGLVCESCHALWDNPRDSFLERAAITAEASDSLKP